MRAVVGLSLMFAASVIGWLVISGKLPAPVSSTDTIAKDSIKTGKGGGPVSKSTGRVTSYNASQMQVGDSMKNIYLANHGRPGAYI